MSQGRRRRALVHLVCLCAIAIPAGAQVITRDTYFDYLPPPGQNVAQTRATVALKLFGDPVSPTFHDKAPVDGIDDARGARLLAISERFSPIVHRNNFSVPRDPFALLGARSPLMSDLWVNGRRVRSDTVYFTRQSSGDTSLSRWEVSGTTREENDARIAQLIASYGPRTVRGNVRSAEADSDRVLFFDFPGSGPRSWRNEYKTLDPRHGSKVFAHPFAREVADASGDARFQVVLQFWFFYPLNDAANSHEGDWEHINVVATTRERATGATSAAAALLTTRDVQRLLEDSYPLDSLVVASVDYYIHHLVLPIDYLELANTHGADAGAEAHSVWEDVQYFRRVIRTRLAAAGGRLATHPIVYIGGNNKGPAELLKLWPRFKGSLRRNSGASFPFPGYWWNTLAGVAVTESVGGGVVPRLQSDSSLPWYSLIDDEQFVIYRAPDIMLLPDWELLESALKESADVRAEWGWFLLPIRWGFPVSSSLGAGMVKHTNVGNISPMGIASAVGWNRTGITPEHLAYPVKVLRTVVSPNTPWALVANGWGVFNLPLAGFGLMPGYNVALIQVMPWLSGAMHILGAPPRRTFSPAQLPRRITTEGQGVFRDFGGRGFASLLAAPDSTTAITGDEREQGDGTRLWFNIYLGGRLSLENTFSWSQSDMRYVATTGSGAQAVAGSLEMRQLTGGVRYDLFPVFTENVQFFARGGYGWLWYRAKDQQVNGVPAPVPSPPHEGYFPSILPSRKWLANTWYTGAGVEAFTPRRYWLFGLLGYGVRVEFTEFYNKLRYGAASGRPTRNIRRGDLATSLVFGW